MESIGESVVKHSFTKSQKRIDREKRDLGIFFKYHKLMENPNAQPMITKRSLAVENGLTMQTIYNICYNVPKVLSQHIMEYQQFQETYDQYLEEKKERDAKNYIESAITFLNACIHWSQNFKDGKCDAQSLRVNFRYNLSEAMESINSYLARKSNSELIPFIAELEEITDASDLYAIKYVAKKIKYITGVN